jgi:hypothetical protein
MAEEALRSRLTMRVITRRMHTSFLYGGIGLSNAAVQIQ